MSTMRASVLVDVARLELQDVSLPEVGARDVLLRPAAVGVCGTDFHIVSGESNYNFDERGEPVPLSVAPQILGHEIAAEVLEVGAQVTDLAPGARVVVDQGRNCHSHGRPVCEYCATGDTHQCEHYTEHGITGLPGGLAERLVVPAVNCVALESDVPWEHAVLSEPLGCVVHSSDRALRAESRYALLDSDPARAVRCAVVLGAGPAGLLFVQHLRALGYEGTLLVSDPHPEKRALAERFGAETVDPRNDDLTGFVLERTGGRRAEYLVEASGSGSAYADFPSLIRKQATVLAYGIGHGGGSLELLNQVQWKEPTFVMSVGASGAFDADKRPAVYRRALRSIESGAVDVAPMITHRYDGLEAVPEAFGGDRKRPGYVKGVVLL